MRTLAVTTRLADSAGKLRVASTKTALSLYRLCAIVILYGVLAGVFGYMFLLGFYAFNSSWAAPFIVSPTNSQILDLTAKIVSSEQALSTLVIDRDRWQASLADMKSTEASLRTLDSNFVKAISLQEQGNLRDAPALRELNSRKHQDNLKTSRVLSDMSDLEANIDKDLTAGLITKGDAASAKAQIRQSRNLNTDGQISEVLLRDSIRQKSTGNTSVVDTLAREAELKSTLADLTVQIVSGQEQLNSDNAQIAKLNDAIATAQKSPYFLATQNSVNFAFVPYDNQAAVSLGAKVYDCYLNMVLCREVGAVSRVFKDEEKATHPIFRTDIRGFLIELALPQPESAKGKVLFLGHKPLYF